MTKKRDDFTEEEVQLAHFIAHAFTDIANMIMNSENPKVLFSMVMDGIGQNTEHIAYCEACDNSAVLEQCGLGEQEYRELAQVFNTKLRTMMGIDRDPLNTHLH